MYGKHWSTVYLFFKSEVEFSFGKTFGSKRNVILRKCYRNDIIGRDERLLEYQFEAAAVKT